MTHWQLSQNTVDFRNEERRAANAGEQIRQTDCRSGWQVGTKLASELVKGDVLGSYDDGYVVESVKTCWDGRISISLWRDASGGIRKALVLDPNAVCTVQCDQ